MKTTAKDFLWDVTHGQYLEKFNIPIIMIEFAKKHVEEALKQASEKAEINGHVHQFLNHNCIVKDSILEAYSLENIK